MKKNKGVTLVALVVTIIVLIILAGVSVSLLLGENGLIAKAKSSGAKYKDAAVREHVQLIATGVFTKKHGSPTWADYVEALNNDNEYEYILSLTKSAKILGNVPTIAAGTTEIYIKINGSDIELRLSANGRVTYASESVNSSTTIPSESTQVVNNQTENTVEENITSENTVTTTPEVVENTVSENTVEENTVTENTTVENTTVEEENTVTETSPES